MNGCKITSYHCFIFPGLEGDHSPPCTAEAKNDEVIPLPSNTPSWLAAQVITPRATGPLRLPLPSLLPDDGAGHSSSNNVLVCSSSSSSISSSSGSGSSNLFF
jgi:hypothetical protein